MRGAACCSLAVIFVMRSKKRLGNFTFPSPRNSGKQNRIIANQREEAWKVSDADVVAKKEVKTDK